MCFNTIPGLKRSAWRRFLSNINMASRSGTIDGEKRPCRRIVTNVEKVFGNNCHGVERSDSL